MDVVHHGEFGGARFYPFNRKPDPPPDDYSKHNYLVGYIDPSTNVLRQEAYRAKTPKEAADAVAGGVSAELRYDFGIDKNVEVIWVKDEKGEVQDIKI